MNVEISENIFNLSQRKKKFIIHGDKEMTKNFKPSNRDKKIRLTLIEPEGGIKVQDINNIDELLKFDAWEGNIKLGRYRLCDIKVKFK